MPKDLDSYLAGIFDGEGCICASINTFRSRSVTLKCFVHMGSRSTVELFQAKWGGRCKFKNKICKNGNEMWEWHLWGGNCVEFLEFVINFCRIKKPMAELALPLAKALRKNTAGIRISNEEFNERVQTVLGIQTLNSGSK